MWTNLHRRFTIWLGRRTWYWKLIFWDHDRTKRKRQKQWKFESSDD